MGPPESIGQEILKATFSKVGDLGGGLLRKTVEKLENDESSPWLALTLLAFAVHGEASRAELISDGLDFTFQCNASPVPVESLLALLSSSGSERARSLKHLARAISLASTGDYGAVKVEMWDGARGVALVVGPKGQSQKRLDRSPFDKEGMCWRFTRSERSGIRSLGRFVGSLGGVETTAEASVLRERAVYTGVSLWLNRGRINKPINLGPCLLWCSMAPLQPVAALELSVERPHGARPVQQTAPAATYIVVALGARNPRWQGLRLVVGGTLFLVEEPLGFRDVCAVASSVDLEANLEQDCVIRNDAFRDLMGLIRAQLLQMALALMGQLNTLSHDEVSSACQITEELAERLAARPPSGDSDADKNLAARVEEAARASLELRSRFQEAHHPDRLPALETLAAALRIQGKTEALNDVALECVQTLRLLADQHRSRRRPIDAVEALQKAIMVQEQLEPCPRGLADDYRDLAMLMKENRLPNSEVYLEKALACRSEAAGVPDPAQAANLLALADQYRSQRNFVQAEKSARQALEIAEAIHGPDNTALVPFLQLVADVLKSSGRYGEGTDFERRAVRLRFRRS